jgi:hypothetical protein
MITRSSSVGFTASLMFWRKHSSTSSSYSAINEFSSVVWFSSTRQNGMNWFSRNAIVLTHRRRLLRKDNEFGQRHISPEFAPRTCSWQVVILPMIPMTVWPNSSRRQWNRIWKRISRIVSETNVRGQFELKMIGGEICRNNVFQWDEMRGNISFGVWISILKSSRKRSDQLAVVFAIVIAERSKFPQILIETSEFLTGEVWHRQVAMWSCSKPLERLIFWI